ncbi:hypothetical protein COE50_06090 [Bacillus anthracis]|nr:hypothetical protein COE50_06090 [Bacillus anthracis]
MNREIHYSIVSSVRFTRCEKNRKIIEENFEKGETNFVRREDGYGDCFEMDLVKRSPDDANEDWLLDQVISLAKRYKITEFELWKKNEEDAIYEKGIGIEIIPSIDILGVKYKESYSGSLSDWNFSWSNGQLLYEKLYF